jgi:hypothetical protein
VSCCRYGFTRDIVDDAYLAEVDRVIEDTWRAQEDGVQYSGRTGKSAKLTRRSSIAEESIPQRGDHLNIDKHVAHFPVDGGVLTTGAEFTYGSIGHYVALGPGDSVRLAPLLMSSDTFWI